MMYLVSYDIQNTRVRTKIAKVLLKAGLERVQYSVFIGDLGETEVRNIVTKAKNLTDKESNYAVLILPLHQDMLKDVCEIGSEKLDWEYLQGIKVAMII